MGFLYKPVIGQKLMQLLLQKEKEKKIARGWCLTCVRGALMTTLCSISANHQGSILLRSLEFDNTTHQIILRGYFDNFLHAYNPLSVWHNL